MSTLASSAPADLSSMKRPELQKLCKDYNIKANLRTDQLVELLTKQMSATDLGPRPTSTEPRSKMPVSTKASASRLRRSLSQPTLAGSSGEGPTTHTRSTSKESNTVVANTKPVAQPATTTKRPAATTSTSHTRNPSTKIGKENGSVPVGAAAAGPATRTVKAPVASTTGTVSKGIAGRIAVFGRTIGKPAAEPLASGATNVSRDATGLRKTATRSAPQRSTTPAVDAQAQATEALQADVAALQKAAASSEAIVEALRAEFKAFETLLATKDAEIRQLQEQLDESKQAAAVTAAANAELQTTIGGLIQRLDALETCVQERDEEIAAKEAKAAELNAAVECRLTEVEATVATVSQQIARTADGQRSVQPSPAPFGLPVSSEGSPYVMDYPRYLDLQLTPSSRRRGQFRPEFGALMLGQDALSRYDGFGRNLVEDSPRPFA